MVTDARGDPLVAEVLSRFPGAEIVDVRVTGTADLPEFPDPATVDPEAENPDD
jgi:DNA polymerase-3 subunit gamma/tau